jgi:hypothetical protein
VTPQPTFSQIALVVALRQMFNQKNWFDWCAWVIALCGTGGEAATAKKGEK